METIEKNFSTIEEEREYKFNVIASVAYVNIYTLSKEHDTIALFPFDPKNKEHLFVLNVAKGVSGVMNKPVAVDANFLQLGKLNRKLSKECRYHQLKKEQREAAFNPDELLKFMRSWAVEVMGETDSDFNFGHIYDEFYAPQKG